ncbi:hypothetical protein TIFTF001_042199 [Ficus carica]|uniref:Uncharacterized protein n=1 Tax=Ficus carica TaxID=3494 RepID=A0AA88CX75_FICCA|nr:hypothetical protein TIFTF001_042199 [Ficus carica]
MTSGGDFLPARKGKRRLLAAEKIAAHDDRETPRLAGERGKERGRDGRRRRRGGRNGRRRRPVEKEGERAEERECRRRVLEREIGEGQNLQ